MKFHYCYSSSLIMFGKHYWKWKDSSNCWTFHLHFVVIINSEQFFFNLLGTLAVTNYDAWPCFIKQQTEIAKLRFKTSGMIRFSESMPFSLSLLKCALLTILIYTLSCIQTNQKRCSKIFKNKIVQRSNTLID